MLNSVFGSGASVAEGEHAATSRAQASNAILPALRIPLSMIRLLRRCSIAPKRDVVHRQILTIDIVCNIHMMVASRGGSGSDGTLRRLGGRASKAIVQGRI